MNIEHEPGHWCHYFTSISLQLFKPHKSDEQTAEKKETIDGKIGIGQYLCCYIFDRWKCIDWII
jgi:hypothetical protein